MILDTGSNKVITSENFVNDEQNFKIGNLSVILEILHSKLYSNPMKAMIQEIISNAVDANKENNQENTPIEITFPNVFSNSFSIKDNGIGIDKNRMADIFINYGSSTKRNTNDQIGCFGIGAKSPFAYSDNFTIETITKDGFKRIYFAYVGENKIGKMNLISEEKTEENTGTKIIITCKKDDEQKFINYVAEITRYFPIKPIIKNTDENIYSKFKEDNVIYTHNNASLIATEYYGQNNNQIIIGNIPYPLPEIKNQKAIEFLSRFYENKCRILLRYNTGQIAVSASREQVEITDKNMELIAKDILALRNASINQISNALNGINNWKKANCVFWNKYISISNITGIVPKWRNKYGYINSLSLPKSSHAITHYESLHSGLKRDRKINTLNIAKENLLIVTNKYELRGTETYIKRIMELNPGKKVALINIQSLRLKLPKQFEENFEELFEIIDFSGFIKPIKEKLPRKHYAKTDKIDMINSDDWSLSSEAIEQVINEEHCYIVTTHGKFSIFGCNNFCNSTLRNIEKILGKNIYRIPATTFNKNQELFSKWNDIESGIVNYMQNASEIVWNNILRYSMQNSKRFQYLGNMVNCLIDYKLKTIDISILTAVKLHSYDFDTIKPFRMACKKFKNSNRELTRKVLREYTKIEKTIPLWYMLSEFNKYNPRYKELVSEFQNYINLKESTTNV